MFLYVVIITFDESLLNSCSFCAVVIIFYEFLLNSCSFMLMQLFFMIPCSIHVLICCCNYMFGFSYELGSFHVEFVNEI